MNRCVAVLFVYQWWLPPHSTPTMIDRNRSPAQHEAQLQAAPVALQAPQAVRPLPSSVIRGVNLIRENDDYTVKMQKRIDVPLLVGRNMLLYMLLCILLGVAIPERAQVWYVSVYFTRLEIIGFIVEQRNTVGSESRSTSWGSALKPFVDSATQFLYPFEHGTGDTMWGPVYDS